MSSKSGSTTSAQSIPDWLRDPTVRNLNRAEQAASIGYQPYFGPDVAAFNPTQNQGFQNTQNALASFGMAPRGSQVQTGMPPTINAGGVSGYASSPLYDQAVAELALRDPNQMARYGALYNPNINQNSLNTAINNKVMSSNLADGGSEIGKPPTQDFAAMAKVYGANPTLGEIARNIHSGLYKGPLGLFAKNAQDPWAKNQDHNFIASTFGMSPNDSAYTENIVDSTKQDVATANPVNMGYVPNFNQMSTLFGQQPFSDISGGMDGGLSGDAGVSGANSESSHSADGNNSGSDSGGFGGGTGDSAGDDGWYKGGKVTKNRLRGMNPPGPDDGYGALQDGEYVVSKKAVDKYGTSLLGKINSGKMSKKRKG